MGDRRLGKPPAWIAEARDGADNIVDEAGKAERPKARRFRMVPFGELRPGPEPLYLVDELIPVAGLVDGFRHLVRVSHRKRPRDLTLRTGPCGKEGDNRVN